MTRRDRLQSARHQLAIEGLTGRRPSVEESASRLRRALESLGPLFAGFGRYLGDRVDLLPLRDCRELAGIDFGGAATPLDRIGGLLRSELGAEPGGVFAGFDDRPQRVTFLYQWHRASLPGGEQVVVRLLRPEAAEIIDSELELLPVLEELRFGEPDWRDLDLPLLVEDYVVWLDRQLDLGHMREALDSLADQVLHFDALVVPRRFPDLSSRRVLVAAHLGGDGLDTLLARPGDDRDELARRLCLAWLGQALLEEGCIEGPLASNLVTLPDDRFVVTGGLVTPLDVSWRDNLLDALTASARQDPDRVCDRLLAECEPPPDDDDRNRLRSEFRLAEPFRAAGWSEEYSGRRLAETLFVQLRLLHRAGYRLKPHAVSFFRGLAELESASRTLAPVSDGLADAIDDMRLVAAAVEVRRRLGPSQLRRLLDQLVPVVQEVASRSDELVSYLRGGGFRIRLERRSEGSRGTTRSTQWPQVTAALLLLIAVTVTGVALIRSFPASQWLNAVVAGSFVAASAGVFWLVARVAGSRMEDEE